MTDVAATPAGPANIVTSRFEGPGDKDRGAPTRPLTGVVSSRNQHIARRHAGVSEPLGEVTVDGGR
jgi:hypothetical protein